MGTRAQLQGIDTPRRVWRFAQFEFDEASRELRADGVGLDLEPKPLEVLYQLLLHAGEVVSREELFEAVWPGVSVVEGSLATAVSKLRKALGDNPAMVVTAPRVGYRLGVPVHTRIDADSQLARLGFQAGGAVPGRDQWRFVRKLDASQSSEVWLAEHQKTREVRVFKFAADGVRLKALKREVTLARLLKDSLGDLPAFVRVLDCNFDEPPFYIETEYSGDDLMAWAESQGGMLLVPLADRLGLAHELSRAVAAAHSAGVLHKDLKPANILITSRGSGERQLKVADFGSGALTEPERLGALGITASGFTQSVAGDDALTGTLMYLAP
jgi:DNA-binding winged helix-turn-helix (wHTH) protein